jgi:hypothetical protein
MKKLIHISAVLLFCTSQVFSQTGGSGTLANPYYGTVSTNTDWYPDSFIGGTIYVLNLTITSGATLSIRPGPYYGGTVKILSGYSLTIQSGCSVIINPGTGLTADEIYNSGTLVLESASNEMAAASLIHDIYDDNGGAGVVQIRHFLRGGQTPGGDYRWHYIASPIPNITVSTYNTQNLAQYIESLVTGSDNSIGWVAYDGYQYSTRTTLGNTFNTLTVGKGYNYYSSADAIVTYTGQINVGSRNSPVTCGTGYPDYQGYNLIGNPYAACLDWDVNWNLATPAFVNNAIYFTLNGAVASYVSGIGSEGGTGTIPPLQGFFVKTNPGAVSVPLRPGARVHNVEQLRYKKKSTAGNSATDTISFVRLKMRGSNDSTDLVVRFNKNATNAFDAKYDAYEFSKTSGDINIWTTFAGTDYSINGLPFPETGIEVPVGINLKLNGTFRLLLSEMKKLENYSILLKDSYTNQLINLRNGEYAEFTSSPGSITDRYVLVINKSATAVADISSSGRSFAIYSSPGKIINIRMVSDIPVTDKGTLTVYDMTGRKLYQQKNVDWHGPNDTKMVNMDARTSGLVLVEVLTGNIKVVEKVLLH